MKLQEEILRIKSIMGVINEDFFISNNKTEIESILMEKIKQIIQKYRPNIQLNESRLKLSNFI
jgi:hypothetical protein